MADPLVGAWPATVVEIETGTTCRRIRARIEGLFDETPYWCQPAGVPGAGGIGQGSKYPLQIGQQIFLFFIHGDAMAGAIYLTGPYGIDQDTGLMPGPQFPNTVSAASEASKDIILWEDETFLIGIIYSDNRKQFRAIEKSTGTGIIINAADGPAKVSKTLLLQSMTAIRVATNGLLQMTAAVLQLHDRRVQKIPQKTI